MRKSLYSLEKGLSGKLSIMPRPRGGDWLSDEIQVMREAGVDVLVSCLTAGEIQELDLMDEAERAQERGIAYRSFPIPDLNVPAFEEQTFTFLEELQTSLTQGKHLAIHCRAGIGRSGLMAASVLVLAGWTPEQAFEQLSRAREHEIPETEEQKEWVKAFFQRKNRENSSDK